MTVPDKVMRFADILAGRFEVPRVLPLEPDVAHDRAALRASFLLADGTGSDAAGCAQLAGTLRAALEGAPCGLFLARRGPDWPSPAAFQAWLADHGLCVEFAGLTGPEDDDLLLAVLANHRRPPVEPAPDGFRVVAIVTVYNEADIIVPLLEHLIGQGVGVYLIDNWSTDGTAELAHPYLERGLIGLEQFPPGGRPPVFDLRGLLVRIEAVSRTLDAAWIMHHDADEIRESPWPGVNLRDALYHVGRCGYNAINHAVLDFYPTDNAYQPGTDLAAHFTRYEIGQRPGHFLRINAWQNTGARVSLVPSGGHRVQFPGQRVYPFHFLLRHYSLRTEAQSIGKIRQRRTQVPWLTRLVGWHRHYDALDASDAQMFAELCAWARRELPDFDPATFYTHHLMERIAGPGLVVRPRHSGLARRIPAPLVPPLRAVRRVARRAVLRWF